MKIKIALIMLICTAGMAQAQNAAIDTVAKKAITDLAFITGQWEGSGWMIGVDGVRHEFTQSENIRFKLDTTAILIEGKGFAGGRAVHNALAVIRFNATENRFDFYSFLSSGKEGVFKAFIENGELVWYLNEGMKYTVRIDDKGNWYEKGEMNMGESWFQFFETNLHRK